MKLPTWRKHSNAMTLYRQSLKAHLVNSLWLKLAALVRQCSASRHSTEPSRNFQGQPKKTRHASPKLNTNGTTCTYTYITRKHGTLRQSCTKTKLARIQALARKRLCHLPYVFRSMNKFQAYFASRSTHATMSQRRHTKTPWPMRRTLT